MLEEGGLGVKFLTVETEVFDLVEFLQVFLLDRYGLKRCSARDNQTNVRAVCNEHLKGGNGFSPFTTITFVYTVQNDDRSLCFLAHQLFKSVEYLSCRAPCFNPGTDFCDNAALKVLGKNENSGLALTDSLFGEIAQQMCLARAPFAANQEIRIRQDFERRALGVLLLISHDSQTAADIIHVSADSVALRRVPVISVGPLQLGLFRTPVIHIC